MIFQTNRGLARVIYCFWWVHTTAAVNELETVLTSIFNLLFITINLLLHPD